MKRLLLIAALAALGGCTSSYTEQALSADHPANAAAPESPPVERSRTLEFPAPQPAAKSGGMSVIPPGAVDVYACPMHPEVTSDKPSQRCPKCGMQLKFASRKGEQS